MMAEPNRKARRQGAKMDRSLKGIERLQDVDVFGEIRRIEQRLRTLNSAYQKELRRALGRLAGIAIYLMKHPEKFEALIAEADFAKRLEGTTPDVTTAFRTLLHLAMKGTKKARTKRVSKYFCALNPLVLEGVVGKELTRAIKERGGIEKLSRANSNNNQQEAHEDENDNDTEQRTKEDLLNESEDDEAGDDDRAAKSPTTKAKTAGSRRSRSAPDGRVVFEVNVTLEELKRLGRRSPKGRWTIDIDQVDGDVEWVSYVCVGLRKRP